MSFTVGVIESSYLSFRSVDWREKDLIRLESDDIYSLVNACLLTVINKNE